MAKLSDLKAELDSDLAIDHTKLQMEAANNPILYSKWANKIAEFRINLIQLDNQKKRIYKDRLDYHSGRSEVPAMDVYDKSEMKTVMAADEEIVVIDSKIALITILMDFCVKGVDAVKSRGFSIKHIIDLRQFEAGA